MNSTICVNAIIELAFTVRAVRFGANYILPRRGRRKEKALLEKELIPDRPSTTYRNIYLISKCCCENHYMGVIPIYFFIPNRKF